MNLAESRVREFAGYAKRPGPVRNGAAVLSGALVMAWPAFYNGFPLIYPDTMTYVDDGRLVAGAVFLHRFSEYYGMRSLFYCLGILPLHWNITLWPVVAVQCLLTAYILWLVVRSFQPRRTIPPYLVLVALLSLFTGMSWYATLVMPDMLGPLLYLSIYLLVFAGDTLTRGERATLYIVSWFAITSHATHLLLAAGMWVILALLLVVDRSDFRRRVRPVLEVAAIVALAAAAQLALEGYLHGKPSLNGDRPPFLTARVIADGPGRWYLEKHCGELKWVICNHVHNLPDDEDDFMWAPDGIYQNASDDEDVRLGEEEIPFVLATLRAYPREEISRAAANFWDQLRSFGFEDLGASGWALDEFDSILPRARSSYVKSRQARNALPLDLLTSIQFWTVMVSLVVIAVSMPLLWRREAGRMAGRGVGRIGGLSVVIVSMVVANALVTGTLSMVDGRYECRVIWLVPLLAGMCVLEWRTSRRQQGVAG